jgi:hypothetical protein
LGRIEGRGFFDDTASSKPANEVEDEMPKKSREVALTDLEAHTSRP